MRIYQIFTRLFGNQTEKPVFNGTRAQNGCGTLDDITDKALVSIKEMGFTHIWLTGILDHATTTDYSAIGMPPSTASITKGKAGSPYAIRNFFDIAPDLARDPSKRREAFGACVQRAHNAGLKVIIDFVPNHTAREYRPGTHPDPAAADVQQPGFHPDNFYFYLDDDFGMAIAPDYHENPARATGNDAFTGHPTVNDWYETVKINYGRDPRTDEHRYSPQPRTWEFMMTVLQYWADQGIDGFRCDMVDMIPLGFWKPAMDRARRMNSKLLFIGESYIPTNYQPLIDAGFDLLYDKVALYDSIKDRLLGKGSVGAIGKALWESRGHDEHLLRFTENHDEPRLASKEMFGKTAPALAAFFATAVVGRELMVYAGQELGERAEVAEGFSGADGKTTIFDYWSVDSLRRWCHKGHWDEAGLLPAERALRQHYKDILALHALLETEQTRVYNLQTANTDGYGAAQFEDGLAIWLMGTGRAILAVVNFTNRIERFTIRVPMDAFGTHAHPTIGKELLHISDTRTDAKSESLGDKGMKVSVTLGAYGCLALRM